MATLSTTIGLLGFALAALSSALATILLLLARARSHFAAWLLTALVVSCGWSLLLLYIGWSDRGLEYLLPFADAVYLGVWVLALGTMLGGAQAVGRQARWSRVLPMLVLPGCAAVYGAELTDLAIGPNGTARTISNAMLLIISLLGLLAVEQVFRNAGMRARRVWLPLTLAVGPIFVVNIFIYSQALLFGAVLASPGGLRGYVAAAAAPLIIIATKRQPDWERQLFVSRHVVFYTASLTAMGCYLIAMAFGGYLVGASNEFWGPIVQAGFLITAALVFAYAVFSADLRARAKVFIAKHFYRNRYDYREEWLRLIRTLAETDAQGDSTTRAVEALANIIGSRSGEIWLRDPDTADYRVSGQLNCDVAGEDMSPEDRFVQFMERTRWVIDLKEYMSDPEKYANAFSGDSRFLGGEDIYVPLVHGGELFGFVRLERPSALGRLGYEDHDLLKTAGQQVAIFLAQERATESLSQARQLEAFSRLTTFLMHDLKNLVAQQELVVLNAKKHKHQPEFVDDAIRTIDSSVRRMRKLLGRLQEDFGSERVVRVDLLRLLREVCVSCADRSPVPTLESDVDSAQVSANRERLAMAVTHAVRNAQDATAADGRVVLRLSAVDGMAAIEIADTGVGMDAAFIRDRLFRPFDSTKGAQGMGIGAYQIRETLRAASGRVSVSSAPGRGTTMCLTLPLATASRPETVSSAAVERQDHDSPG